MFGTDEKVLFFSHDHVILSYISLLISKVKSVGVNAEKYKIVLQFENDEDAFETFKDGKEIELYDWVFNLFYHRKSSGSESFERSETEEHANDRGKYLSRMNGRIAKFHGFG